MKRSRIFKGYACDQKLEEVSTLYVLKYDLLKKHHLFVIENHQRTHHFIACSFDRNVEVLSTNLCLKDTGFEMNSSFDRILMRSTSGRD
jgi:hypothetical protein